MTVHKLFSLTFAHMMKTIIVLSITIAVLSITMIFAACGLGRGPEPSVTVIRLTYKQGDIQKAFDTLYNYRQQSPGVYNGFIEQALATCHDAAAPNKAITQDVFSSMYLDTTSGVYDCVTNTTFRFPGGTIAAAGVFNLTPGSTIAPDHDFPIIGGSGAYKNTYGTYTRKYRNGVYHVKLQIYKRGQG
jgi:hypothetical protein